jgi:hypothetical protein
MIPAVDNFLRQEEYIKMKENYQKALCTMNEVYLVEIERFRMSAPIDYEELTKEFT